MATNKKPKILVVDDNLQDGELFETYLSSFEYEVVRAYNGQEALEKIKEDFDLVLLDAIMPKLNGYEVCRKIKKDEKTRFIPVVMITSLGELEDKIKAIESGADDFFNKPANKYELLARVKSLIRLKHLNEHLENTENVLFTMAQVVEAKDPFTEGHLERMAGYSSALGKYMGLSSETQEFLKYGGILHDIGKIGISENILCKPGPLTEEEYKKMKEHTIIGEKIVMPLRFSNVVAPIVRGHHERWDGSGYPDGRAGENVPHGARIVSVVDAYDAMTSDRPYRKRMPKEKAVKILQEGAGAQWDPELVRAFIKMIKSEQN